MSVVNAQKDALTSDITLEQFGKAMAQLDLSGIEPHNRPRAVMAHLAAIMAVEIHDKQKASELTSAVLQYAKRQN